MTTSQNQDDKKDEKKPISVGVSASPEVGAINVERQGAPRSELSGELLAPLESAKERPETQSEKKPETEAQSGDYAEKSKPVAPKGGDYNTPQVFGYKVPPKLAANPTIVSKLRKKGNPNNGIVSLYIFLDRLFRMKPSTK